jgi:hypothetical protein
VPSDEGRRRACEIVQAYRPHLMRIPRFATFAMSTSPAHDIARRAVVTRPCFTATAI